MSEITLNFKDDNEKNEFLTVFVDNYKYYGAIEEDMDIEKKFAIVFEGFMLDSIKNYRKNSELATISNSLEQEFKAEKEAREEARKLEEEGKSK